jgi:glutamate 5-kinase
LREGNSLLPVGLVEVTGNFRRGDVVTIVNGQGAELGRGLAEYGSDEARRLTGSHTEQIEERLGYRGRSAMVHRDEMVFFEDDS